ncbi:MAG: YbaK/EbsC family protein [Alphaproteobacteria bacterium]|nr:YbaK/EbsC family protein [Alphaproteobacteria bacterium]
MPSLSTSAQKVQAALVARGFSFEVQELNQSTRTAAEAAAAIGCDVAQIAKSILFRGESSGRAVLVIASGTNRVDEKAVAELLGEQPGKADADFVRQQTGFVIGGVPPIGHDKPITTFIDEDILAFDTIWAAAGTPFAVFRLDPKSLATLTGGQVARVALPSG